MPTKDEILSEPAGPRLDRWVAEALGARVRRHRSKSSGRWLYDLVIPGEVPWVDYVEPEAPWSAVPKYSRDALAAMRVVARERVAVVPSEEGWYAVKPLEVERDCVRGTDFPRLRVVGREGEPIQPFPTVAEAVAKAFLLAKGE